jgi:hypothetical protein
MISDVSTFLTPNNVTLLRMINDADVGEMLWQITSLTSSF